MQAVAGIVERRHTLPILANVLIRKTAGSIEFTTSDLEIQVRTTAELGGDASSFATTVGARKLIDILRSLPADQAVTLSSSQTKLTLAGGKSRFTLQTMPADDFPLVQESADFGPMFSVPQKTLKNLVAQVHFAMAVHDIRYYLNGILFGGRGQEPDPGRDRWPPPGHWPRPRWKPRSRSRKSSCRARPCSSCSGCSKTTSRRSRCESHPTRPSSRSPAWSSSRSWSKASSPTTTASFRRTTRTRSRSGARRWLQSLQRAAILTSEKFKGVRVNIEPGTLRIASSNAEQEEAMEELEIDYGGDAIEIGFNVTYLIDALANMGQEMVTMELQDTNSSALITVPDQAGFKYVVMPMRI